MPDAEWCYSHHPDHADERRRRASRGGKSGGRGRAGVSELKDVKAQLQDLTTDVLSGDLETGPAAVANQLINTRLRAIAEERKVREVEELERRIEALEQHERNRPTKGARSWR